MKRAFAMLFVSVLALALAPSGARADPAPCEAFEIEYTLAANLRLEDTPMGEGDGVYKIGPGSVTLRFENREGQPGGSVKMLSYAMREYFEVVSKKLFFKTTVLTDTRTAATPDKCAIASEGVLTDRTLRWVKVVRGYRTDGTLTCTGSMCGKLGAPPPGTSELHIGPGPVVFSPFVFSADMQTFTMASTYVAKTTMPKQTAYVSLAGRETKRSCVQPKPCN